MNYDTGVGPQMMAFMAVIMGLGIFFTYFGGLGRGLTPIGSRMETKTDNEMDAGML